MFYYIYILESEADGKFYTGYTSNLKLGKYFVVYDSLKPKNSVLLPFLPVPDSITSALPKGWKELPIPVDKEEIRKFLVDY